MFCGAPFTAEGRAADQTSSLPELAMSPAPSLPTLQPLFERHGWYVGLFIGLAVFAIAADLVSPA